MATRIGLQQVRALGPGEIIWDTSLVGFGARRQRGDAVSYLLFYRTPGKSSALVHDWPSRLAVDARRRPPGSAAAARHRGRRWRSRCRQARRTQCRDSRHALRSLPRRHRGRPRPHPATNGKKSRPLKGDRGRIERHIKPLLGALKVASVTREDIDNFMHAVAEGKTAGKSKTAKRYGLSNIRGGKTAASRTVGLLGAIFGYAVQRRMRLDNPARGVVRFKDGRRERRLSDQEYQTLGKALQKAEAVDIWPPAIAAAQFLLVTGWRSRRSFAAAVVRDRFQTPHGNAWRHQDRPQHPAASQCCV